MVRIYCMYVILIICCNIILKTQLGLRIIPTIILHVYQVNSRNVRETCSVYFYLIVKNLEYSKFWLLLSFQNSFFNNKKILQLHLSFKLVCPQRTYSTYDFVQHVRSGGFSDLNVKFPVSNEDMFPASSYYALNETRHST